MKVSEKRIAEWWEAPGVDGRESFDEEILYLNSLLEEISLPRWAVLVRDLMPRWGFEPCSHRFLVGLEQVLGMIGEGRVGARVGGCADIPLSVYQDLEVLGTALVQWAKNGGGPDPLASWLGSHTPERAETARVFGEVALAVGQGPAALDEATERWAERAQFPLARALVDGDESPLPLLFRHACAYNFQWSLERLVRGIGKGELPPTLVCKDALQLAPKLDPARLPLLRSVALAVTHWLQAHPPKAGLEMRIYAMLGPRDGVRRWLVASLYKTLKLWQIYLDQLLGERHSYFSLL